MTEVRYTATGRRKTSIARIIVKKGAGQITVNNRSVENYFSRETLRMIINQPLEITGMVGKLDVVASVVGGGPAGQAGAIRHGISIALVNSDSDFRPKLKREGLLTRDPREKERKKYGQKGARKRFQFSKR
ncbi:MAG: 30S ribosomal protein S9 [Candidatus Magnetobacterium sp. LHC-1]|uniref:Small ribosomal subunit protein uS9 n=1 Tax=Candidatus Magnetobacterium casense TaxID=1455061 RepID=A0ABS6RXL2_9BACT|nr:30S ribosomal protein S9 [Candidatus Magnetobacterium casensis]MBF0606878.1 30S ribosomal protein S9 [Nitrospirota bacterium]MBV6341374.1 30S ribosomal protein S9 [Candidatus Magnetobacterium casensis]